ncbi:mammalian cell entry protein [Mycobacterium sp. SMC-4]|uniref:mammalian cell entry protein n=1 Tax=Mycobacterium sp. SMC-4 TaxID=2857059 RepID=UPI0021B2D895|nr:mammalian cell entry protein [Mycobacterium sp. SMC-4]UXA17477.1 mammalian cell entry protein [Mycobacterium sp. SMC-4]
MTDEQNGAVTTKPAPRQRRKASRAAGPAEGSAAAVSIPVASVPVRPITPAGPPPRRSPNRRGVLVVSLAATVVLVAALSWAVFALLAQQRADDAVAQREQRYVDTASQVVVNMFSYHQDTIEESVNRFVDSTSGPLRDMLSQDNNVDNLKAIFRSTMANSEAVINGAALESIDDISGNAQVLVSVRVTVTDLDGTDAPSQPYRLRITVHEDDNGHMTGYDVTYPDGGN